MTLKDGETEEYMRYTDVYIKRNDGTLDVIRGSAEKPLSYAPGAWTDVKGDEKESKRNRFGGLFKR